MKLIQPNKLRIILLIAVYLLVNNAMAQSITKTSSYKNVDVAVADDEHDNEESRKVIGSSVVTSVSVILNGQEPPQFTDAIGKPVPRPLVHPQVASPINLLNPDRYEFYTFNDNGELIKRLMTMKEIQSIVAGGEVDGGTMLVHSAVATASLSNNNSSSSQAEQYDNEQDQQQLQSETKVRDIVENVQNVLNREMEMKKNHSHTQPILDTPDVSSTWSIILPAIFGNTGVEIKPNKQQQQQQQMMVMTPDSVIMEQMEKPHRNKTAKPKPKPTSKPINQIASSTTSTKSTVTTDIKTEPSIIRITQKRRPTVDFTTPRAQLKRTTISELKNIPNTATTISPSTSSTTSRFVTRRRTTAKLKNKVKAKPNRRTTTTTMAPTTTTTMAATTSTTIASTTTSTTIMPIASTTTTTTTTTPTTTQSSVITEEPIITDNIINTFEKPTEKIVYLKEKSPSNISTIVKQTTTTTTVPSTTTTTAPSTTTTTAPSTTTTAEIQTLTTLQQNEIIDIFNSTSSFNQILESLQNEKDSSTTEINLNNNNNNINNDHVDGAIKIENINLQSLVTQLIEKTTTSAINEEFNRNTELPKETIDKVSNVFKDDQLYVNEIEPEIYEIPTTTSEIITENPTTIESIDFIKSESLFAIQNDNLLIPNNTNNEITQQIENFINENLNNNESSVKIAENKISHDNMPLNILMKTNQTMSDYIEQIGTIASILNNNHEEQTTIALEKMSEPITNNSTISIQDIPIITSTSPNTDNDIDITTNNYDNDVQKLMNAILSQDSEHNSIDELTTETSTAAVTTYEIDYSTVVDSTTTIPEDNRITYETSIVKETSSVSATSNNQPILIGQTQPIINNEILQSVDAVIKEEKDDIKNTNFKLNETITNSLAISANNIDNNNNKNESSINIAAGILDAIGVIDDKDILIKKFHIPLAQISDDDNGDNDNDDDDGDGDDALNDDINRIILASAVQPESEAVQETVTNTIIPEIFVKTVNIETEDNTVKMSFDTTTAESSSAITNVMDTITENYDVTKQKPDNIQIQDDILVQEFIKSIEETSNASGNEEELSMQQSTTITYDEDINKVTTVPSEKLEKNDTIYSIEDFVNNILNDMDSNSDLLETSTTIMQFLNTDIFENIDETTIQSKLDGINEINTELPLPTTTVLLNKESDFLKLGEKTKAVITTTTEIPSSTTFLDSTTSTPIPTTITTTASPPQTPEYQNEETTISQFLATKQPSLKIDDLQENPINYLNHQKPLINSRPSSFINLNKVSSSINSKQPSAAPPSQSINLEPSPIKSLGLEESVSNVNDDIIEFSKLCNEIAFSFWRSMTTGNDEISATRSLTISPFALTSMLAMIFLGARGSTSGEMNEILRLDDMVTFNPHLIFRNITDSVELLKDSNELVNSAFIRELFSDETKGNLLTFYKDKAQQFYSGYVEEVNFTNINDIVRRRTNLLMKRHTWGRINEYLKTNNLWLQSPLAGISANVFQTNCSDAVVNERDGEMFFQVSPKIRQRRLIPIPAVLYRTNFTAGYDSMLDATLVAIGNSNNIISTIYIMPGQQGHTVSGDNLERLETELMLNGITKQLWHRLLTKLIERPGLEVQIPRFSHRSFINATYGLQKMGLNDLFNFEKADLSGLIGLTTKDLYLSDMMQINTFSTCAEDKILDQHHIEIYPKAPQKQQDQPQSQQAHEQQRARQQQRQRNIYNNHNHKSFNNNNNNNNQYQQPPQPHQDYQRSFYDPLYDLKYLELPLPLRPRQARIPETQRLRFDKPFLYFVRHNPTGMILYMGRFNPRLLP